MSGTPVADDVTYEYRVEQGPVPAHASSTGTLLTGRQLCAIAAGRFDDPDALKAAGRLLRFVIRHHLGGKELKSRKVLIELRRDRMRGLADGEGSAPSREPGGS